MAIPYRSTNMGGMYVKSQWFEQVSSGTTGTVAGIPQGAEILLDTFGGGVDAVVSSMANGLPDYGEVKTSGGTIIAATIDEDGNYALSGTPASYPIAVIYSYRIQFARFNYEYVLNTLEFTGTIGVSSLQGKNGELTIDTSNLSMSGSGQLNTIQNIGTSSNPTFNSLTITSTVDGRDVSVDGAKLDGIESGADVTDAENVASAGAIMDSDFSSNGVMIRTGAGSYTSRTITGTANQVVVTNGNGLNGNPTLSTPQDIGTASNVTFGRVTSADIRPSNLNNGFVPYANTTTKQLINSNMFFGTGAATTGLAIGGTDVRGECTVQRSTASLFTADTDPTDAGRFFVNQNNSTSNAANLYSNITLQANAGGSLSGGRLLADIRLIRKTLNQSDCFFMLSGFLQGGTYRDFMRVGFDHTGIRANTIVGSTSLAPVNRFDVSGACAIGASYAGVSTAPTNGLIVQGKSAIGTTSSTSWVTLGDGTNTSDHVLINGERTYSIKCVGSGAATSLAIKSNTDNKELRIISADESISAKLLLANTKTNSTIFQTAHTSRAKLGGFSSADSTLELEETQDVSAADVTDGFSAALTLDPEYSATGAVSRTVTRHNYMDVQNPSTSVSGGASLAVTDACVMRFDAAAGTHKAVDSGTTKSSPGTVNAWVKVNINGTIHFLPAYTSKTS